mmetsp:Transcript_58165/g.127517  ORF Transcript_58165/g.127517 Transcript_58165/m.127517 type:complete len:225 (+) Transcript_58165:160-834(+)
MLRSPKMFPSRRQAKASMHRKKRAAPPPPAKTRKPARRPRGRRARPRTRARGREKEAGGRRARARAKARERRRRQAKATRATAARPGAKGTAGGGMTGGRGTATPTTVARASGRERDGMETRDCTRIGKETSGTETRGQNSGTGRSSGIISTSPPVSGTDKETATGIRVGMESGRRSGTRSGTGSGRGNGKGTGTGRTMRDTGIAARIAVLGVLGRSPKSLTVS